LKEIALDEVVFHSYSFTEPPFPFHRKETLVFFQTSKDEFVKSINLYQNLSTQEAIDLQLGVKSALASFNSLDTKFSELYLSSLAFYSTIVEYKIREIIRVGDWIQLYVTCLNDRFQQDKKIKADFQQVLYELLPHYLNILQKVYTPITSFVPSAVKFEKEKPITVLQYVFVLFDKLFDRKLIKQLDDNVPVRSFLQNAQSTRALSDFRIENDFKQFILKRGKLFSKLLDLQITTDDSNAMPYLDAIKVELPTSWKDSLHLFANLMRKIIQHQSNECFLSPKALHVLIQVSLRLDISPETFFLVFLSCYDIIKSSSALYAALVKIKETSSFFTTYEHEVFDKIKRLVQDHELFKISIYKEAFPSNTPPGDLESSFLLVEKLGNPNEFEGKILCALKQGAFERIHKLYELTQPLEKSEVSVIHNLVELMINDLNTDRELFLKSFPKDCNPIVANSTSFVFFLTNAMDNLILLDKIYENPSNEVFELYFKVCEYVNQVEQVRDKIEAVQK
jgi:hypothetical protein